MNNHFVSIIRRCELSYVRGEMEKYGVIPLEEKGLVCRRINEKDRRQKFVSLTEKGEEIYEHIRDIYKSWDEICYTGFSREEQLIHQDHIKRIAANAVAYRKKD